jgi:4-diphosphocytidyl-2-C-methyl-D-erythritol kinase
MDVSLSCSSVTVQAPAKLNLFLEVIAKRADGFHEIETLMTAISLYDTLLISPIQDKEIQLTWRWASGIESRDEFLSKSRGAAATGALPTDVRNNIVWKAAELLRRRSGAESGAAIHLVKRIPTESGMGGASSDAAAALIGLNRLWQLGYSPARLSELGGELGSDVPFFLGEPSDGATMARCTGRGEIVETVPCLPQLHFVIVRPPQGLSTAAVYQRCRPAERPRTSESLQQSLRSGDAAAVSQYMFNRLQEPAESLCPLIGDIRGKCSQFACLGHQMSGSGSSYFAVCRNARQARRLAGAMRSAGVGQVYRAVTAARALSATIA